jgi:L-iditol 2-dehydrogenase
MYAPIPGFPRRSPFPRILGHEVAGTVAAVGNNVKGLEIGQPVAPDMIIKCGVCKACRTGRANRCQRPTFLQYGGGYADFVCVPQRNIHLLRPTTSLKAAAMMEPLACVLRGQDMLRLYPGEVELVVGLGPIGLMHMQVARNFGARVIASDPVAARPRQGAGAGRGVGCRSTGNGSGPVHQGSDRRLGARTPLR